MLKRKGPHKPEFAHNTVRMHFFMIYMHLIEYNIVSDTKIPLLRFFRLISKLKAGDIITTGQYRNYQTFSNRQFRPLLKNSFHSIHTDLRDTTGEKYPLCLSVSLVKKASIIHFEPKRRYKMVVSRQVEIPFYRGLVNNMDVDSVHLHKILVELQFHFWVNISSQLQKA